MEPEDQSTLRDVGHVHECGLISLRVPSRWTQTREGDYSLFYLDGEKLGTLRVISSMYYNEKPATAADARSLCEKIASGMSHSSPLVWGTVEESTPIVTFECDFPDDDEPIKLTSWLVSRLISPNQLQIVVYTYTADIPIVQPAEIVNERSLVDIAIRGAIYWDEADRIHLDYKDEAPKPTFLKRLFRRS